MLYKTKISKHSVVVVLMVAFVFQGCKKDAGNGGSSSGYYLNATVDGAAWSANVNSSLNNAPAVAAITSNGSVSVMFLVGIKAANKDSSAVVVIFPQDVTVNKKLNFDASQYSEGGYLASTAPGATTYYTYNTTPATGGSGSFTITTFDQTAKLIEGTFTGTFGSQTGRAAVQITNGKFRVPYTTDVNQLPKSGNIKF